MNTVVVVEDDSAIITMLTIALGFTGDSTVLSVKDAESALDRLSNEKPEVILCDVKLPGMSGAEFTDIVKSAPALSSTPVILMSAHGEPEHHAADAFVSKPFDPYELAQLVEELAATKLHTPPFLPCAR
jgi:CheY-like chemotaxis protein